MKLEFILFIDTRMWHKSKSHIIQSIRLESFNLITFQWHEDLGVIGARIHSEKIISSFYLWDNHSIVSNELFDDPWNISLMPMVIVDGICLEMNSICFSIPFWFSFSFSFSSCSSSSQSTFKNLVPRWISSPLTKSHIPNHCFTVKQIQFVCDMKWSKVKHNRQINKSKYSDLIQGNEDLFKFAFPNELIWNRIC
jgi:hypothetical protein